MLVWWGGLWVEVTSVRRFWQTIILGFEVLNGGGGHLDGGIFLLRRQS